MMNEELEMLVWLRIEGEISPEDRERLERLEADNPDIRRQVDELVALSDALSRVEEVAPPPELRPRIDRALACSSPRWRRAAPVVNLWRPRIAYLAAGLVVGGVVARLLLPVGDRAIEADRVTGAMRLPAVVSESAIAHDLGEGRGALSLWRDGHILLAALTLTTDRAVELIIETEIGAVELVSTAHSGGSVSELLVEEQRVVVRAEGGGRHLVAVAPAGDDTPLDVVVVSGGDVLTTRKIVLKDLREGG